VGHHLPVSAMRDMVYGGVEHVALSAIVREELAAFDRDGMAAHLASAYARALAPLDPPEGDRLAAIEARLKRIESKL
jgi:hypothetical protein